jgi:hypothetical protein
MLRSCISRQSTFYSWQRLPFARQGRCALFERRGMANGDILCHQLLRHRQARRRGIPQALVWPEGPHLHRQHRTVDGPLDGLFRYPSSEEAHCCAGGGLCLPLRKRRPTVRRSDVHSFRMQVSELIATVAVASTSPLRCHRSRDPFTRLITKLMLLPTFVSSILPSSCNGSRGIIIAIGDYADCC